MSGQWALRRYPPPSQPLVFPPRIAQWPINLFDPAILAEAVQDTQSEVRFDKSGNVDVGQFLATWDDRLPRHVQQQRLSRQPVIYEPFTYDMNLWEYKPPWHYKYYKTVATIKCLAGETNHEFKDMMLGHEILKIDPGYFNISFKIMRIPSHIGQIQTCTTSSRLSDL